MRQVLVANITTDEKIYPRNTIDTAHVADLARALNAGEKLPPIIIDGKNRVVDGAHRLTAWRQVHGVDSKIPAEIVDYPDDAAAFLDAVTRNARHGVKLNPFDRARTITIADALGITRDALATAMAVKVDVLGEIKKRSTATDSAGNVVAIKRSARHLAGTELSDKQIEAIKGSSGWPVRFHAQQIIDAIRGDLIDYEDAAAMAMLRELHDVLSKFAVPQAV